jgi:hypothetical protein
MTDFASANRYVACATASSLAMGLHPIVKTFFRS